MGHHFGLVAIVVLGVAGLLIGGAARALFNRNRLSEAHKVPIKQNLPRITSGWDYRPKEAIRRFAAAQGAGRETAKLLTPRVAKDNSNNVLFDDRWLEFEADSLVHADNVDSTVEEARTNAPLADHICTAYDQSPIDEQTALLHDGRLTKDYDL